ncbi:MAG: hypothetical protein H3C30_04510 [Candidatus Hydrogenedentes bacterium]|nr:hypothetical protein [Candidatus Hydrogenedentota bacterium]
MITRFSRGYLPFSGWHASCYDQFQADVHRKACSQSGVCLRRTNNNWKGQVMEKGIGNALDVLTIWMVGDVFGLLEKLVMSIVGTILMPFMFAIGLAVPD